MQLCILIVLRLLIVGLLISKLVVGRFQAGMAIWCILKVLRLLVDVGLSIVVGFLVCVGAPIIIGLAIIGIIVIVAGHVKWSRWSEQCMCSVEICHMTFIKHPYGLVSYLFFNIFL